MNSMYLYSRLVKDRVKEKIMTDTTPYFVDLLQNLLEKAKENKEQNPKGEKTRHWAVVYTELEKVIAYVRTYLL